MSEQISRSLEAAQPGFTKLTNHSVPLMSGSNLGLKPDSKKNIAFHHKSTHSVLWLFFVSMQSFVSSERIDANSVLVIIPLSQV